MYLGHGGSDGETVSFVGRHPSRPAVDRTVLAAGRRFRRFTRAQLATESTFSQSTITHSVHRLIDSGYFREVEHDRTGSGRPVGVLEFDPASELTLVANVTSASVIGTVLDADGAVIDIEKRRGATEKAVDAVVDAVLVRQGSTVRSVVIAVPGITSRKRGHVKLAPSLDLGESVPLGERLADRTGLPVFVDNDVNLMAVGEAAYAPGEPSVDTVFFYVGESGIGAALVLDGEIHRGRKGAAGEIGFLPIPDDKVPRSGVGRFEHQWSASGIAARAAEARPVDATYSTVEEISESAHGDACARELLESVERAWATALLICVCVVAPRQVVLAGAAADLTAESIHRISEYLDARSPVPVSVRQSRSGKRGLLLGALRLAHARDDRERRP